MRYWKNSSFEITKNTWHHIEVYMHMNTISNNKGNADGVMMEWIDGVTVFNKTNILYRTAHEPTKQWEEVILAPYIQGDANGSGSPVAQTMYIDELTVGNTNPYCIKLWRYYTAYYSNRVADPNWELIKR